VRPGSGSVPARFRLRLPPPSVLGMAHTQTYEAHVVEIGRLRRSRRARQILIRTATSLAALAALGAGWFALYLLMSYGRQW
jgi:hypothetical protein